MAANQSQPCTDFGAGPVLWLQNSDRAQTEPDVARVTPDFGEKSRDGVNLDRRVNRRIVGGTLAARLAARADSSAGPDACWPWRGHLNAEGYGVVCFDHQELRAHRVALELRLGRPLAPGEVARHLCHRRDCVNGAHLEAGSPADNIRDSVLAGRHAHGEAVGSAKLTESQVAEIRRLAPEMGYGRFEELGRRYGVSGRQIANIVRGQRWRLLSRRAA